MSIIFRLIGWMKSIKSNAVVLDKEDPFEEEYPKEEQIEELNKGDEHSFEEFILSQNRKLIDYFLMVLSSNSEFSIKIQFLDGVNPYNKEYEKYYEQVATCIVEEYLENKVVVSARKKVIENDRKGIEFIEYRNARRNTLKELNAKLEKITYTGTPIVAINYVSLRITNRYIDDIMPMFSKHSELEVLFIQDFSELLTTLVWEKYDEELGKNRSGLEEIEGEE